MRDSWAQKTIDARTPKARSEERENLDRDVERFLSKGREITECPPCLFLDSLNNYGEQLVI